jgi:hypothetical protein
MFISAEGMQAASAQHDGQRNSSGPEGHSHSFRAVWAPKDASIGQILQAEWVSGQGLSSACRFGDFGLTKTQQPPLVAQQTIRTTAVCCRDLVRRFDRHAVYCVLVWL